MSCILQTRMNTRVDHMNMNLENFQIQKRMLQTVTATKVDEKMGSFIVQFPCFLSELWPWKCLKKYFLKFCADLGKKSKSIKTIYIHASERSPYARSGNGIVYYAMAYFFVDIGVWNWKSLLNICWVSIFSYVLIANIS